MNKANKHRRSLASDEPIMDINTTPLIDVMLVLLIMLIITIPVQLHSVNLNMPTGTPPPQSAPPEVLRIDIGPQSVVTWNGEPIAQRDELERRMAEQVAKAVQPEVHLRPDR